MCKLLYQPALLGLECIKSVEYPIVDITNINSEYQNCGKKQNNKYKTKVRPHNTAHNLCLAPPPVAGPFFTAESMSLQANLS
jgi:hypothetical protein